MSIRISCLTQNCGGSGQDRQRWWENQEQEHDQCRQAPPGDKYGHRVQGVECDQIIFDEDDVAYLIRLKIHLMKQLEASVKEIHLSAVVVF